MSGTFTLHFFDNSFLQYAQLCNAGVCKVFVVHFIDASLNNSAKVFIPAVSELRLSLPVKSFYLSVYVLFYAVTNDRSYDNYKNIRAPC